MNNETFEEFPSITISTNCSAELKDNFTMYYKTELEKAFDKYHIVEFDKSEETESGVFGVHIVFQKKKENN